MKAEYLDNPKAGPGNGLLLLSEAIFPDEPWTIAIQRGSDKYYLSGKSQNTWTGEAVYIPVHGTANPDGSLFLELPPAIVNELEQQEQYAVSLKGNGETQKARLRVTEITYSPTGRLGITPDARQQPERKQEPVSAIPDSAPPGAPATAQETARPQSTPPRGSRTSADSLPNLPDRKPAGHKAWRWLLLGLLILACLAWYYLDPRSENTRSELPQTPQTQPASPQPKSVKEQVDEFFRAPRTSPDQAMRLASQLQPNSPAEQDALYRLYYFAAENGDQPAFIPYAQALDPALPKWGSIEKNGLEAWNFYNKSADPKALEMKKNLRGWLESQSAAGNMIAREWLEQIR